MMISFWHDVPAPTAEEAAPEDKGVRKEEEEEEGGACTSKTAAAAANEGEEGDDATGRPQAKRRLKFAAEEDPVAAYEDWASEWVRFVAVMAKQTVGQLRQVQRNATPERVASGALVIGMVAYAACIDVRLRALERVWQCS